MAANDFLMSAQTKNLRAVEMLLNQGVDPNVRDRAGRTALMYAALDGDLPMAELLIRSGVDVNAQDRAGYSALHFAAQEYRAAAAELLLNAGAQIDPQDSHGNTPLFRAVFNSRGRGDVILLLLKHGANRLLANKSGVSALDLAETIGNYDTKQFFNPQKP